MGGVGDRNDETCRVPNNSYERTISCDVADDDDNKKRSRIFFPRSNGATFPLSVVRETCGRTVGAAATRVKEIGGDWQFHWSNTATQF